LPTGIAIRCDGDDRVGAGHVARCLQIALACRRVGIPIRFIGRYRGVAAALLASERVQSDAPGDGPLGVEAGATGVIVDSYELPAAEVEALDRSVPVAVVWDGGPVPPVTAVLAHHLDAAARCPVPERTTAALGPDFAPVPPGCLAARRPRGLQRVVVTLGGGAGATSLLQSVVDALLDVDDDLEVFVAGVDSPPRPDPRVRSGILRSGLAELMRWADVAVSGAGSTAYELACAGVPAVLLTVADNQAPVATAFAEHGLAMVLDARNGVSDGELRRAIEPLTDSGERERLAAATPALIDGYGAFRARDALLAAFAGRRPPRVLRYRPVRLVDGDLLLSWRNDPEVRAASRSTAHIGQDEHRGWLTRTLAMPDRLLLVVERDREPIGTVRFDRNDDKAEIATTVARDRRSQGVGRQMIREASELYLSAHPDVTEIFADVRGSNQRSLTAFRRAGFMPMRQQGSPDRVMLAISRARLGSSSG
jgi:spore coat polysaccharide biosynthesis predicted glycosyltransferase SpsG/RimJ/RimL family protein N-acetyltransferase